MPRPSRSALPLDIIVNLLLCRESLGGALEQKKIFGLITRQSVNYSLHVSRDPSWKRSTFCLDKIIRMSIIGTDVRKAVKSPVNIITQLVVVTVLNLRRITSYVPYFTMQITI